MKGKLISTARLYGATAALSEPVEEREAPARERLAASLLGEYVGVAVEPAAARRPVRVSDDRFDAGHANEVHCEDYH